jgi:ABC-type glycerol-3-phosphate transport system substrate-binding protein
MRYLEYLKRFTYTPNGFYDYLKGLEDAANGDVDLVILPAMTGSGGDEAAFEPTVTDANDTYTAEVTVKVVNSNDETLEFYNGTLEIKAVVDASTGTVAINDGSQGSTNTDVTEDLAFEDGVCTFTVTLGGTWAEDDTLKITVDEDDVGIMGYSVEKNNHFLIDVVGD